MARILPRLPASLRYWADMYVPLLWLAAQAAWTKAVRSHRLPWLVWPLCRLPALWRLPGHIAAHDVSGWSVGKRLADLVAFQLRQRRDGHEEEPARAGGRVDLLRDAHQVRPGLGQALGDVDGVTRQTRQAG